jgi:hypothetical protein
MHYGSISELTGLGLDEIDVGPASKMRARLDGPTVGRYRAAYAEGADLPPLEVIQGEDGTMWCWDGAHRHAAARELGWQVLPCRVEPGTLEDAIRKAAGANAAHGLPRSAEDLRCVFEALLADPEIMAMDCRSLATLVGCSKETARKYQADYCERHLIKRPNAKPGRARPARNGDAPAGDAILPRVGKMAEAEADGEASGGGGFEDHGEAESPPERAARQESELLARLSPLMGRLDERCRALLLDEARFQAVLSETVKLLRDRWRHAGGRKRPGPYSRRVAWVAECPDLAAAKACLLCQGDDGLSSGRVGSERCTGCHGHGFTLS